MTLARALAPLKAKAALYVGVAMALVIVLLFAWAMRLDHLRGSWQAKFEALSEDAGTVLVSLRLASDNPDLQWSGAAAQATALGNSNRDLKASIARQRGSLEAMAREAVRLRSEAEELKRIADQAQAQRRAALDRLADATITPGTRDDCEALLAEAEAALDLVYKEGL